MSDVGNPSFGQYRKALPAHQTLPVMFLGGPLDHTTRRVERDETAPEMPKPERMEWADTPLYRHGDRVSIRVPEPMPNATYYRHRIESGPYVWFCYILEGHQPSRRAVLDANPYF